MRSDTTPSTAASTDFEHINSRGQAVITGLIVAGILTHVPSLLGVLRLEDPSFIPHATFGALVSAFGAPIVIAYPVWAWLLKRKHHLLLIYGTVLLIDGVITMVALPLVRTGPQ